MSLKLVNWNVEWATPRSRRRSEILSRIDKHAPEVICLTEAHVGLLSQDGHTIYSQADYGHAIKEGRRKVLLWSRETWKSVDDVGIDSMPPGRFVSGVTQTSLGEMTVVGVCIPWSRSRVGGSGVDRRMWEDHEQYLVGLAEVLERTPASRLVVVGDFNQRIGQGGGVPAKLRAALQHAIPQRMTIATSGIEFQGRRSIDHIALSEDLTAEALGVISNIDEGRKLSDHFGIIASLSDRSPRVGWDKAAQKVRERGEDGLLDEPTPSEFDDSEWVW